MLRILFLLFLALLFPRLAYAQADHGHHMEHESQALHTSSSAAKPTQAGQAAFAAIQEIVQILEDDPATDWSQVDIESLRQHLIDMDNITLRAEVVGEPVEGGMRFVISGTGPVKDSIQRMVTAHAATMDGEAGWKFTARATQNGAILTVVSEKDAAKLRGLGFIGIMTRGMHHQHHHLMIARGNHPHH